MKFQFQMPTKNQKPESEVRKASSSIQDAVGQLCPACGLCCNGVLFGDVELQRGDDAQRLSELGAGLFRKGRKVCFHQPCQFHDGSFCNIYQDRPNRCRTFECRLLQRVALGSVSGTEALRKIRAARREVEAVRKLVRRMGQTDERVPLNLRYAAAAAQPLDFSADKNAGQLHGSLTKAVGKLTSILECDFLA